MMKSGKLGPYRVISTIGSGGMGVVYKAYHLETGIKAAIKTVISPESGQISGMRREIHALAGLNHPGIIKIYEEGVDEGVPWYAMEYLDGKSLRGFLADLWESNYSQLTVETLCENETLETTEVLLPIAAGHLDDVLGIVTALCESLAYLHSEGMVHRDLKPENIFLRQDRSPVIMDFGLVSRYGNLFNHQMIETTRLMLGTLNYMAPEQIKGDLVDARTDLYSLGCLLYELFSGSTPFGFENPKEIYDDKMSENYLPLATLVKDIPAELDQLVTSLLKGNPKDRIGYADDVAAIINSQTRISLRCDTYSQKKPYLYRAEFHGRSLEFSDIERRLCKVIAGSGDILLVGGETGSGKSRLLVEIGRYAEKFGFEVLTATGNPIQIADCPFSTVTNPVLSKPLIRIADCCRQKGEAAIDSFFSPYINVLRHYDPSLSSVMGREIEVAKTPLSHEELLLQIIEAIGSIIAGFAKSKPVLLLIDDLHSADETTIRFIEYLSISGMMSKLPCFVIASYRLEEIHPLVDLLCRNPQIDQVQLHRLSSDAMISIIKDMLSTTMLDSHFINLVLSNAEGNPFYISEYLKIAVDRGYLYRDKKGRWKQSESQKPERLPISRSLSALLEERIISLSANAQLVCRTAAVIGIEFSLPILLELVQLKENDVIEGINELMKRSFIEETSTRSLRFIHAKVQQQVYDSLTNEIARDLHCHLATCYLTKYEKDEQSVNPAILAYHLEKCQKGDSAYQYYLIAAENEQKLSNLKIAETYYSHALGLNRTVSEDTINARLKYASCVLDKLGKLDEARNQYESAMAESSILGYEKGRACSVIGLAKDDYYELDHNDLLSGLDVLEHLDDEENLIIGYMILAYRYKNKDQLDIADHYFKKALVIAEKSTSEVVTRSVKMKYALYLQIQGKIDESLSITQKLIAEVEKSNDKTSLCELYKDYAILMMSQSKMDQAKEYLYLSLTLAKQIGLRILEGLVYKDLSIVERHHHNFVEAQKLIEQAIYIWKILHRDPDYAIDLGNLSIILIRLQNYEEGVKKGEEAVEILKKYKLTGSLRIALTSLATAYYYQGRLAIARDTFKEAYVLHQQANDFREMFVTAANISGAYFDDGEFDKSEFHLLQSLEHARKDPYLGSQFIPSLMNLALFNRLVRGNIPFALRYIDEAITVAEKTGHLHYKFQCLCEKAQILLANDDDLTEISTLLTQMNQIAAIQNDIYNRYRFDRYQSGLKAKQNQIRYFRGDDLDSLSPKVQEALLNQANSKKKDET